MKTQRLLLVLLLAATVAVQAQTDTIAITGTVYNQHTRMPEPYCLVQLLQDSVARAVRVCDREGFFFIDSLPAGTYTLNVGIGRLTLYQNDFELLEPANLSIYVDTVQLIRLSPVDINSQRQVPRHPGTLLITSTSDRRLWNLSGRMTESGPASADLSGGPKKQSMLSGTVPIWYYEFWSQWPTRKRKSTATPPSDTTATR